MHSKITYTVDVLPPPCRLIVFQREQTILSLFTLVLCYSTNGPLCRLNIYWAFGHSEAGAYKERHLMSLSSPSEKDPTFILTAKKVLATHGKTETCILELGASSWPCCTDWPNGPGASFHGEERYNRKHKINKSTDFRVSPVPYMVVVQTRRKTVVFEARSFD